MASSFLTHYVVVRRDLPLGVAAAQIVHAAGESFYKLTPRSSAASAAGGPPCPSVEAGGSTPPSGAISCPHSSVPQGAPQGVAERPVTNRGVSSSTLDVGSFDPSETRAIVLGARNESRLLRLLSELIASGVPHVAIREPDSPYNGALMAIGLVPGRREELSIHVNEFHMLRELSP